MAWRFIAPSRVSIYNVNMWFLGGVSWSDGDSDGKADSGSESDKGDADEVESAGAGSDNLQTLND